MKKMSFAIIGFMSLPLLSFADGFVAQMAMD
jgi:hypothetical protein